MSSQSATTPGAVFLSYAREDSEAARRIADALRASGVGVWFDQNELVGGDAWDAKIRVQIASCALFVPVISANTQARLEGYFRIEWKLAAQRTHAMAEAKPFLLPVVIDATRDTDAHVPADFRGVQWTRLTGDGALPHFCALVQNLLVGETTPRPFRPAQAPEPVNWPTSTALDLERTRASTIPRKTGQRRVIAAAVIVATFLVAVGFIFLPRLRPAGDAKTESRPPDSRPAAPSRVAGPKSLAVLPFKNLNADSEGETYSLGICDELCTALGRIQGLRVAASSASFSFRDPSFSHAEIARQLGVGFLLDGSVQKIGSRIRIRAQLLRPPDVFPVWSSDNFDKDVTDIFKLQETIARLIAQNLELQLGVTPRSNQRKVHPEAYQFYLQASEMLERGTRANFDEIERLLNEALKLDPQFAPAMLARVRTWYRQRSGPLSLAAGNAQSSEAQFREKAEAQIRAALTIDPDLADAHTEMGLVLARDFSTLDQAEVELLRAVRLNASDGRAHQILAMVYNVRGDVDRSQAESALSAQLNTLSYGIASNHAWSLRESGRPGAALQFIERSPVAGEMWALVAHCLIDMGRAEEATNRIETMLREHPGRSSLSSLIAIFARLAQRSRAEQLLETRSSSRIDLAQLRGLAALGRTRDFIATLQERETNPILAARVLNDLEIFLMRDEPGFKAWLAERGLAAAHARIVAWRKANPPEAGVRR